MRKIDRIAITGATSSLGTALISECIIQNIEILAFANRGSRNLSRIPQSDMVKVVECTVDELVDVDGLGTAGLNDTVSSYDAFIHFAWTSTSGDDARNMLKAQSDNIRYSLDAVELASKLGCKVFVGPGSQAEYGRTSEILTEDTNCHPETAYGMAKHCAGQMTRLYAEQLGIEHIWTRIMSGFGPKCQPQTIINYTISELLAGRSPELTSCEQIWDFTYTHDIARAILLLAQYGKDKETYVIGSGHSEPLKYFIEKTRIIVSEMTGVNTQVLYGAKPYGESTVMHLECDISKLVKDTGYAPKYSFEEGIKETVKWVMENQ